MLSVYFIYNLYNPTEPSISSLFNIYYEENFSVFLRRGVFGMDLICFLFEVLYDLVFESTAFFFNAIQELYNLITFKKSNPI